jgi:hypothetical protein
MYDFTELPIGSNNRRLYPILIAFKFPKKAFKTIVKYDKYYIIDNKGKFIKNRSESTAMAADMFVQKITFPVFISSDILQLRKCFQQVYVCEDDTCLCVNE